VTRGNWLHLALEVRRAETALEMIQWVDQNGTSTEAKREAAEMLPAARGRLRWALGELLAAAQHALDALPLVEEPEEPEVAEASPLPIQEEKVAGYQPEAWRSGV
jgi:hypothetical protein